MATKLTVPSLYEDEAHVYGPAHKNDPTVYIELVEVKSEGNPRPRAFDWFLTIEQTRGLVNALQTVLEEWQDVSSKP